MRRAMVPAALIGAMLVTVADLFVRAIPLDRPIPIGVVKRIDIGDGDLDRRIHVQPAADLKRTDLVQVLTEPHADLKETG